MSTTIAIRADASAEIGTGHIMRCLTLADELRRRGARVVFICREILPSLAEMVRHAGHELRMLPAAPDDPPNDGASHAHWLTAHWRTDAAHTTEVLRALGGVEWLIVDHYALDVRWEQPLRAQARRIMVIDDLADRAHDCDVLLDVTPGRARQDYAALMPPHAELLAGPKYALLRPAFRHLRPSALQRRQQGGPVQRILVSFGGNDPHGLSARALRAIGEAAPADVAVDVALGSTAPEELGLPEIATSMAQRVTFHDFSTNMAQLVHDADLAIGAGGMSTWERCCLGLPAIMVLTANNQCNNALFLQEHGAAVMASADGLPQKLRALLQDTTRMQNMASSAATMTFGEGACLTACRLLPEKLADGTEMYVQPLGMEHADFVLQWQHEPGARTYFRNPVLPSRHEHMAWMCATLHNPKRICWILMHGRQPCGLLRIDFLRTDTAEVSILVSQEYRGRGIGLAALKMLDNLLPSVQIRAEVHKDNIASQHLFAKAGFRLDTTTTDADFMLFLH